jgi:hypothetical protein
MHVLLYHVINGNLNQVTEHFSLENEKKILDEHGFGALHLAAKFGQLDIIRCLLNAGFSMYAKNKNDNTPLHSAAYNGQKLAILEFIKYGANFEVENKNGDTPLHSAAWKNQELVVEALALNGVCLETQNNDGDTPLHLASWNGCLETVKILVENGAKVDARNNENNTPLELALQRNHSSIIEFLSGFKKEECLQIENRLSIPQKEPEFLFKLNKYASKLIEKSQEIKLILTDYQTFSVTEYEIKRILKTIEGIERNGEYLENSQNRRIDSAAITLPSNLPLYSLTIFALIPSFLIEHVHVRPNSLLQESDLVSRLANVLDLECIFPNVSIINSDRSGFQNYLSSSSLVVFTGKPSNSEKILKTMKQNSILVVNGSGHNPVVVTETANLSEAIDGVLFLKGFNGGQDCAGPDAILGWYNQR